MSPVQNRSSVNSFILLYDLYIWPGNFIIPFIIGGILSGLSNLD